MKALRIFKVVFCPMAAVLQFFVLPSKVFASVMALLLLIIAALNLAELLDARGEVKEEK